MLTIWKTVSAKPICANENPRAARIATHAPESEICPKTADEYNLFICFFMLNIIRRPLTAKKMSRMRCDARGCWVGLCLDFSKKTFGSHSFMKRTHYPYRAIEKDPIDKNKTGVFHIMRLL